MSCRVGVYFCDSFVRNLVEVVGDEERILGEVRFRVLRRLGREI